MNPLMSCYKKYTIRLDTRLYWPTCSLWVDNVVGDGVGPLLGSVMVQWQSRKPDACSRWDPLCYSATLH